MYYYQSSYVPPVQMCYPYRKETSRAYAEIRGSKFAPDLKGLVIFTNVPNGVEVAVEVSGLPHYQSAKNNQDPIGPHGFHIHEKGNCEVGDPDDPFQASGEHWNPTNQPHGNHAGDFPVLFSNDGYTKMMFFTNKFTVQDVIGKSVLIHLNPDDYRTQPAGDSGKRIGCGVIYSY